MSDKPQSQIGCLSDAPADEALVLAAKNGDEYAFEELVKRHQKKILAVSMRYTRVREDAEDVVQETFQKAFIHLQRFEGKSSFPTWLTRIAINEALMFLRKSRGRREVSFDDSSVLEENTSRTEIPDVSPDPEATYLKEECVRILAATIDNLRPGLRKAIELRELHELSTEETARRMGLSVGAAKGRVFHGRKKLRQKLTRHMKSPRTFERNGSRSHGDAPYILRDPLTSTVAA